ncbi:MAG: hypothetical protein U0Q18_04300 [Bryobacteraceae bacterium]
MTAAMGEAGSPSLSPDGRFIVFVSDYGETGNRDIWVQSVDQGTGLRLTRDPAADYDPVFSGDGKTIYFTSLREPTGIYSVPAVGGEAKLILRGGMSAQVSPDGKKLAFVSATGQISVFEITGASSRPIAEKLDSSYAPKWSPDGKMILFTGRTKPQDELEWWTADPDTGSPISTGLLAELHERGFKEAFVQSWMPDGQILFAGKQGDQITLWRMKVSPDRKIVSGPVRATDSDSGDFRASYAAGRIAFERTRAVLNLWSLPVDANQGLMKGNPQRITYTDSQKGSAALSHDGRLLLYSTQQKDGFRLMLRDLTNGREKQVGPSSNAFYAVMNAAGSRYFWGEGAPGQIGVFTRGVSGWRSWWSSTVCGPCAIPRSVSADGSTLLTWANTDAQDHVDLVDLKTGQSRPILEQGIYRFYGPELSADGAWISFSAKASEGNFATYIAAIPRAGSPPSTDWIRANPGSTDFEMAFWSPDANLLYRLCGHGEGNLNWLEAQRLDPRTKRPLDGPIPVYHFTGAHVPTMDPIWNHPAIGEGRIVLEVADVSSNIWIADASK